MPPKEIDKTLQIILDQLSNLQTQLHRTQELHEGRFLAFYQKLESRQTALKTKHDNLTHIITDLLTTLSSQTTQPSAPNHH